MKQLVKVWDTITNMGIDESVTGNEFVKIRLLNQVASISFVTTLLVSMVYFVLEIEFIAITATYSIVVLYLGVTYFSYKKQHHISRYLYCYFQPFMVAVYILFFGGNFGETNFFAVYALVNFIMYDGKRRVQVFSVAFICLLYIFSKLYVSYYPVIWGKQTPIDDVVTFPMIMIVLGLIIYLYQRSLRESEEEQTLLIQNLEKKNKELQRINEELEDFTYIASHDLKSPLRTINGNIGLAKKHLKEGDYESLMIDLNFVSQSAKQMHTLVSDILEYKVLNNKQEVQEVIDLNEVITDVLNNLKALMIQKNAEVFTCTLPKVLAHSHAFSTIFQNLIENGIKYNESSKPRINIRTEEEKDTFIIAIQDNGIGIEEAYHEKIFQFFKRLHNQEKYQGTGIGLSLCKKIVRNYDGDITVHSEVGQGTTFKIILPIKYLIK